MEATVTEKDTKLLHRSSSDLRQKSSAPLNHYVLKTFSSRRLGVGGGEIRAILYGGGGNVATESSTNKGIALMLASDDHDIGDDSGSCGKQSGGGGGDVRASVPFTWESRPGTPKVNHNHSSHINLPPLTPPPSYFYCTPARKLPKSRSTSLLQSIFPRLGRPRKPRSPPSPATSSSSSSSSLWSSPSFHRPSLSSSRSVPASPINMQRKSFRIINGGDKVSISSRLSLDSRVNVFEPSDDEDDCETSALCFSLGRRTSNPGSRGCYMAVFKVLQGKFT